MCDVRPHWLKSKQKQSSRVNRTFDQEVLRLRVQRHANQLVQMFLSQYYSSGGREQRSASRSGRRVASNKWMSTQQQRPQQASAEEGTQGGHKQSRAPHQHEFLQRRVLRNGPHDLDQQRVVLLVHSLDLCRGERSHELSVRY